jgi:hypothetical protein
MSVLLLLSPAGGGAATDWTPTVLGTAVKGWWDAKDASTITLSGNLVTSWASKVASITADQATGANQPSYSVTARNSLPGLIFNGSSHFLTISSIAGFPLGSTTGMIIVVAQTAQAAGLDVAIDYGATTVRTDRAIAMNASGLPTAGISGFGATSASKWNLTGDRIALGRFATNNTQVKLDGGAYETALVEPITTGSTTGLIGANNAATPDSFWHGTIQEILVTTDLTTDEIAKVEGYLAHKWGITARLPSDHPFKTVAPTVIAGALAATEADDTLVATGSVIAFVAASSGGRSTAYPTGCVTGDVIIGLASKTATTALPVPSEFTELGTINTDNQRSTLVFRYFTNGDTEPTWAVGTGINYLAYRGCHGTDPIGDFQSASGTSTTVSFPTLTMQNATGTSWVAGLMAIENTDSTEETAPSGMTNRTAVTGLNQSGAGHDTNGGVTSWTSTDAAVGGTSTGWHGWSVELLPATDAAAITGTLSVTEDDDTLSATGVLPIVGTLDATEADDTVTATGTLPIVGILDATEADDTLEAAGGAPAIVGELAATEADDSLAATGTLPIAGTLAVTEADDSTASAGVLPIVGTLDYNEADPGTLLLENGGRVKKENNGQLKKEVLSPKPGNDFLTATGVLTAAANFGALAVTEAGDTLAATGALPIIGLVDATEADDTLAAAGALPIVGVAAVTEADDTLSAAIVEAGTITGQLDATEADDTLVAHGSQPQQQGSAGGWGMDWRWQRPRYLRPRRGNVYAVEEDDTLSASAVVSDPNPVLMDNDLLLFAA